jgi:hypothetical protein
MLVGCRDIIVLAVIVVDDEIVVVVAVVAFICCSNEIDMTKYKKHHHNWDHLQSSNLKAYQTKTVNALTAAMLDFGAARQRDQIGRAFTRLPRAAIVARADEPYRIQPRISRTYTTHTRLPLARIAFVTHLPNNRDRR